MAHCWVRRKLDLVGLRVVRPRNANQVAGVKPHQAPAIPAYMSLLNVWSRIEPFTDEASHFALLVNRHLFSSGVVITEIAH